jgi:hypothetical protein
MTLPLKRVSTSYLLQRRSELMSEVQPHVSTTAEKSTPKLPLCFFTSFNSNKEMFHNQGLEDEWNKQQQQKQQQHKQQPRYYQMKLNETLAKTLLNYIETKKIQPKRPLTTSSLTNLSLIGKMANGLDILTVEHVMNMRKEDLTNYGFTIEIMIKECKISITDLFNANVVRNLDDLIYFKFKLTDTAIHDTLFTVGQLYSLFQLDYPTLVRANFSITISDLIKAQFSTYELQTFSFSFDDFISMSKMTKDHFEQLPQQSFDDLKTLGLTRQNIVSLGISVDEAINRFNWSREDLRSLS